MHRSKMKRDLAYENCAYSSKKTKNASGLQRDFDNRELFIVSYIIAADLLSCAFHLVCPPAMATSSENWFDPLKQTMKLSKKPIFSKSLTKKL